jgi:hypothetical protein
LSDGSQAAARMKGFLEIPEKGHNSGGECRAASQDTEERCEQGLRSKENRGPYPAQMLDRGVQEGRAAGDPSMPRVWERAIGVGRPSSGAGRSRAK